MVSAGLNYGLVLDFLNKAEQTIIIKFSKIWHITFARKVNFKNSDFIFAFAKPTNELKRDFQLEREVLILITPYEIFEPRVLDFVDKTLTDYSNRLDKLCIILVSRDNEIKNKIKLLAVQDKETRIIIPFSYDELLIPNQKDIVLERLKESFYTRDLFDFDSPLRNDTYFFGRTQTVQGLYGKYKSGENGCLFGLRKIGKTSVLYAVKRHLELRNEPAVFVDCSETAFHRRRWFETLHFIANEFMKQHDLSKKVQIHNEEEYIEKDASKLFETDLLSIHKHFHSKRLLIVLDEIESITFDISPSSHWTNDNDFIFFWQAIRSIFQKNPSLFSFIIAGVNPKAIETTSIKGIDNPIYRLITPNYLDLFSAVDVKEMVSSIGNYMGLKFEDEIFTYLVDDFGGHPFLIRQVCSYIHKKTIQKRPCSISKFYYQTERENIIGHIQDYIGMIINVLHEKYQIEYELLERLAQGDNSTFMEYAQSSHMLIEHLMGYGLVKEERGAYHFRINTVKEYIQNRTNIPKYLSTREEKWREITIQRNQFELDLRKVLKFALRLKFKDPKSVFLEIVSPPQRQSKLSMLNFEEIFEAEIYFDDLRKIINKNWQELGIIFNNDIKHFTEYFDYVNQHRIDAHAKDISDDDLNILLIALSWLRKQLEGFNK